MDGGDLGAQQVLHTEGGPTTAEDRIGGGPPEHHFDDEADLSRAAQTAIDLMK